MRSGAYELILAYGGVDDWMLTHLKTYPRHLAQMERVYPFVHKARAVIRTQTAHTVEEYLHI